MNLKRLLLVLEFSIPILFCSCKNEVGSKSHDSPALQPAGTTAVVKATPKRFELRDFYNDSRELDSIVQMAYDRITAKERASQLIMDATSELVTARLSFDRAQELISDTVIGGLLFLKGKKTTIEKNIKRLDSVVTARKKQKLLYSCDCEPALFDRKILDAGSIKTSIDLKDTLEVAAAAGRIASIIKPMGIQINFAPVADIALNKKAINNRSFGKDPFDIINKSVAFVRASQEQQIASSIKHFPGHGAVEGDTHKGQVVIDGELTELETFTLIMAKSNPVMVMVGHMTVKNNRLYSTAGMPCSVSPQIITSLLKTVIGYKGIVLTDAMRMSALDKIPDADWKAVVAGADLVLIPRDARSLNRKIVEGLNGKMKDQLELSIIKILRLKVCMGRISFQQ